MPAADADRPRSRAAPVELAPARRDVASAASSARRWSAPAANTTTCSSIYVPIAIGVFALIALVVVVRRADLPPPSAPSARPAGTRTTGSRAPTRCCSACVVAFLLYLTFTAEHQVDTVADRERPRVDDRRHRPPSGSGRSPIPRYGISVRSGTVGRQPLVVPVGEAIRFNLTSARRDPLVLDPGAALQARPDPGSDAGRDADVRAAGVFPGQCAEFCGLRHADMVFTVARGRARRSSRAWAAQQREGRRCRERRDAPQSSRVARIAGLARRAQRAPTTSGSA